MSLKDNSNLAASLARQDGAPDDAAVAQLENEVRTDDIIKIPERRRRDLDYVLGTLMIELNYRLPVTAMERFHRFLEDNEKFLADACERAMEGVHYRGTYMAIDGKRAVYRTVWGYDTPAAMDAWNLALEDEKSNLYKIMKELRAFTLLDPDGTTGHFSPVVICKEGPENRLLSLTLAAGKTLRQFE